MSQLGVLVSDSLKRGDFFGLVGAIGAASALDATPTAAAQALPIQPAEATQGVPTPPPIEVAAQGSRKQLLGQPLAYRFLTPPEQAFVGAAAERLIPTDEHGPGAREADVAYYVDQQLAGAWGSGARQYRQGPWMVGTPEQGYQLNMIPQEVYRVGIARTNTYCQKHYGKVFDQLSASHQDEVLRGLEAGTIDLTDVPAKTFFEMLFGNTIEGYFGDPMYGGNRNKVGWKAIGFPGVAAAYTGVIDKYNVPYKVEPVGIADVEQQIVADPDHRERVAIMHKRPRKWA
jgi:gluconate 2-dehydrogenase gamma chain